MNETYKDIHRKYADLAGSERIATIINIETVACLSSKITPRTVLEVGSGIGTLTEVVLRYSEAHVDAYEEVAFCRDKMEENLVNFAERFTIIPDYSIIPSKNYDLVVIDGPDTTQDSLGQYGATLEEVRYNLTRIFVEAATGGDKTTIFIEGDRYIQRKGVIDAIKNTHYFSFKRTWPRWIDGVYIKGGVTIYCTRLRFQWLVRINYMFRNIQLMVGQHMHKRFKRFIKGRGLINQS